MEGMNEMMETYKEVCTSLENQYSGAQEHHSNQNMYMLTVVNTIFLPITFLAAVYGMNFDNMPELEWKEGYLAYFWVMVVVLIVGSIAFLKYKKII
jgi:magnesium transporter